MPIFNVADAIANDKHKIVTSHIYPPIPDRRFDWCAYFDGEEEKGGYGYGRTEQEAIDDLLTSHDFPVT